MTNFEIAQRNYSRGLWSDDMMINILNKGKITTDEYKEIVGKLPENADLDTVKAQKVLDSKEALELYLVEHPITWTDGNQYSVTQEKQSLLTSNLALCQIAIAAGQPYELKWNTTGGVCTDWTYEELAALALAIGAYVQPLVSYQQTKEIEIMACEDIAAVDAVVINYNTLS